MTAYWILLLLTAFFAYNIGSLDTMVLSSNFVFRRSLRRLGTGNVWLSNFRRIYGVAGFAKLLAVEVVKDIIPILIGGLLLSFKGHADVGRVFAGLCMVLGRLFPVFSGFKGSHASIAMIVAALTVDTAVGIAAAIVVIAAILVTKYLALGTVAGAAVFAVVAVIAVDDTLLVKLSLIIAALVLIKHIPALIRILRGTETRLSGKTDITYKLNE